MEGTWQEQGEVFSWKPGWKDLVSSLQAADAEDSLRLGKTVWQA